MSNKEKQTNCPWLWSSKRESKPGEMRALRLDGNGGCEGVSDTRNCHNELWAIGIGLNLLAQVANMRFDQSRIASFIIAPYTLDNHIGGEDLAGVGDQQME